MENQNVSIAKRGHFPSNQSSVFCGRENTVPQLGAFIAFEIAAHISIEQLQYMAHDTTDADRNAASL